MFSACSSSSQEIKYLQRSSHLKCVVLGECDDLHHFANSGEDLKDDVQGDGVDHVLHDDPEDGVGTPGLLLARPSQGLGGLQCGLG